MESESPSLEPVKRLPYRYPWLVYVPTVILFGLLNYLVLGVTVSEDGTALVMPPYVVSLRETHPDAFITHAAVCLERDIMGGLFFVGERIIGGRRRVEMILVAAWIVHFFELGMCVRICVACHATAWTTVRYSFCTLTAGMAQLVPLQQARAEYLGKTRPSAEASSQPSASAPQTAVKKNNRQKKNQ